MRTPKLFLLVALALAAACDDGDDTPPDAGTQPDAGTPTDGGGGAGGAVRFVHASPDAPAIDLYPKGGSTPLVEDLAYGGATAFLDVDPGTAAFDVRPANAPASSSAVITTPDLTVTAGSRTTVIAAGLLGSTDAADRLRALVFADGFTTPGANEARVRLVNASPDAPTIAFDLGANGSQETTLARFSASGPEGLVFPAGTSQQVLVTSNGTALAQFTVGQPAAQPGATLYAIATGLLAEAPTAARGFVFLPVTDAGAAPLGRQNPSSQLLHAVGDAPEVDVFLGSQRVVEGLAPGELSTPIFPPAGTATLDLFAAGTGGTRPAGAPTASVSTGALAVGTRTLLVLHGTVDAADTFPVASLPATEAFAAAATGARLRFLHAVPGLGPVSAGPVVSQVIVPLFTNVAYGTATAAAGSELSAGPTELGVSAFPSTTPVARFALTIPSGADLFAIAVPAATGTAPALVTVDATSFPWPTNVSVSSALTP